MLYGVADRRIRGDRGDGRFFYPPRSGDEPVPTTRGALLRDGIEDYEYFVILQRLDPGNRLLKVPGKVYNSLTEFSSDPAPIEAHRLALAREIERLTAKERNRKP